MNNLQNLHTHSTFCDGKHTPEELVNFAIEKGFDSIGFSGHSYMYWAPHITNGIDGTEEYKREINRLKLVYKDRIKIYLGLEFEFYSDVDLSGYDYLIGSAHYFKLGEKYAGFDRSLDVVKSIIDEHFDGDGIKFAKAYFELVANLPERGNFDILGHFDIITKNIELEKIVDVDSKEYKNAAVEALENLSGKIPFFEVNTGAIARGYRTTPYPMAYIIKELKRLGFGAVISSDCHDGNMLDCAFEDARLLLAECGFKERYILTDKGFTAVSL